MACVWFGDNERAFAIGILSVAIAVGSCFGFCLGAFFVHEHGKKNSEKIKDETIEFM